MNQKKLLPKPMARWSIKEADHLAGPEDLLHLEYLAGLEDLLRLEYLEDRFCLEVLEDPLHLFRLEDPEDRFRLEYLEDPEDLPIALGFPIQLRSIDILYKER